MWSVSFRYSTELFVSVSVPQLLSPEKSSSSRISPVLITGMVAVGSGAPVLVAGTVVTVWVGRGGVGVDEPCKLDAMRATPPSPKRAQTATRQPTIQTVGIPDFAAVTVPVADLC